jgi:hypothetical protein
MSPVDERKRATFGHYLDEVADPFHISWLIPPHEPRPWERPGPMREPLRELSIAYDVLKLADYLELASPGLGEGLVRRFADEPEIPCGTRVPGIPFPPPKGGDPHPGGEEPIINLSALAAAMSLVAQGVGSEAVKAAAFEASEKIAAQG